MLPSDFLAACSFYFLILALADQPRVLSENDVRYANCSTRVMCGNMEISYPFWGGRRPSYCGYRDYELQCNGDAPELTMKDVTYRVLDFDSSSQQVRVARADYWSDNCHPSFVNTTLDQALFAFTSTFPNLTLFYGCPASIQQSLNSFTCSYVTTNISAPDTAYGIDEETVTCMDSVTVPITQSAANDIGNGSENKTAMSILREALVGGFGLELIAIKSSLCAACVASGGQCGHNVTSNEFACFCPDMPYPSTCPNNPNNTKTGYCEACVESGGRCGQNSSSDEFTCYCSNIPYSFTCPNNTNTSLCEGCAASGGECRYNQTVFSCSCGDMNYPSMCPRDMGAGRRSKGSVVRRKILIGFLGAVAAITVVVAMIGFYYRLKKGVILPKILIFRKKESEDDKNVEAFIRKHGSLGPKRYNYSDVKRMTHSFACKLGQGGFGCVYRGELPDGRMVAVKVLSRSKGNGQDFINEVASISRTSHVNIVSLLGFCFKRSRRALIYEFMPNGSLDKFIYNRGSTCENLNLNLEWTTMYRIAVGIARGLEYLYRGCNTRILHFDIKPHNILLDQNFVPKISDFGLAKLCQPQDSMVSMTQARGTAGYIAPEVFCRNFGGVSHKSDVYSYGMLVLEMVGGRKNIDLHVSHDSQIYFPSWIYKQLQPGNDLTALGRITNKEEEETARKMVLVSLWCIQPNPSDRPSTLRDPPKSFFSFTKLSLRSFSSQERLFCVA